MRRLTAWFFYLLGLIGLGAETTALLSGTPFGTVSPRALWFLLDAPSLTGAGMTLQSFSGTFWQRGLAPLLDVPVWLWPFLIALLLSLPKVEHEGRSPRRRVFS